MSNRQPIRFGVMYDCRNHPDSTMSTTDMYQATIDQAVSADRLGFDHVWFTEHHFMSDGYLPSFQPLAGAIAARTERIRISTDIALLPLYHPIRLAEDLAVLDHVSNGRMELGIGMGYVPSEFAAFGVPLKNRVSMTEEAIDILRLAWGDGPFSYHGKRYQLDDVDVHPKPVQDGGPPLWIAAMSEAGAKRAARFGTNLLPQGQRTEVLDPWRAAVVAEGGDPDQFRVGIIRSVFITDDAERDWPMIKTAERYRMSIYNRFMAETPDDYGWQQGGAIPQNVIVGTAEECVAELNGFIDDYGITDIATSGLPPGIDPGIMTENLERLAHEVVPNLGRSTADEDAG
ncbi:MAG: LLM class flavin-dependent oxidoreductase [Actinomycetia bacterium]|nr:LLM class flavin-dependent oxidoreductase [Actinomycetes bacterium]MCP5033764.1 LLM class flavin-dependent oxidoreductase [Actinomycetes bacterium]